MNSMRSHAWVDRRSLALAEATVAKLRRAPSLIEIARANLRRWREHLQPWPADLDEWEDLLAGDDVLAIAAIVEDSERGRRLRQSSPFAGILTPHERHAIFERYESISA